MILSTTLFLAACSVGQQSTKNEFPRREPDYSARLARDFSGFDVLMSDANQRYAPAGFPAITVPAGYAETGEPTPVVFTTLHLDEGKLLSVAYSFEQAANARQALSPASSSDLAACPKARR